MKIGCTLCAIDGRAELVTAWPTTLNFEFVRSWSCRTSWWYLEPNQKGTYAWAGFDAMLNHAAAHNRPVIWVPFEVPTWASSNPGVDFDWTYPPRSLQDWADFIRAALQRAAGRIRWIEGPNEAQSTEFYRGNVAQAVEIQRVLYQTAKAVDPTILVIAPATTGFGGPAYTAQLLAAGIGQWFDIAAFHGYWDSPNLPEQIVSVVANYRSAYAAAGQAAKPLWDTEFGWSRDSQCPTDDDKVAYISRAFLLRWSLQIDAANWYVYEGRGASGDYNPDTYWGTLFTGGALTPGGIAYREVMGWIQGANLVGPIAPTGTIYKGNIKRGKAQQQVVWNTAGNSNFTTTFKNYKDLTGVSKKIPPSGAPIGKKPILLTM